VPRPAGASLVELLVVLGLAGGVAAFVLSLAPLRSSLALRAAAVQVLTEVRAAQARAIASREPDQAYGLVFAVGTARYDVVRRGAVQQVLQTRALPRQVRITYARFGASPPGTLLFGGASLFGAPSGGGTVTLAAGRRRLCVRVLPATGRVRVAGEGCP
jgi:type II secretory pathway pseudopilin PulG